jgi:site-specific DNA-methyltransferase (adenine-specific)
MNTFHDRLPNPVQKRGEYQIVKTPVELAERIPNDFPKEVWGKKDKKWLVPVSKTGVFELGIYRRLMMGLAEVIPNWEERRAWIVREMIWSFAHTDACELMVRRNYLGKVWNRMREFDELDGNVSKCNFLTVEVDKKDGRVMVKKNNGENGFVKFDYIVGNPPYQDNSKANDPKNIYTDFVLKSIMCKPEYMSMVIPARWLMGSGKGAGEFLEYMLKCKKLSKIVVEKDSSKWFSDVEIKGGVMYFLYDANHDKSSVVINGKKIDLEGEDCIITDTTGLSIKTKVMSKTEITFDKMMLGSCPFEIRSTHDEWSKSDNNSYVCHNSGKGESAKTTFIAKDLVKRNVEHIEQYKICIAAASGGGSDGTTSPFVIGPGHVVSQSYLVMGCFDTEQEANNAAAFFATHLTQFLISLLKNTQNIAKRVFKYLPYLNFTRSYTDQDLYTMFGLSLEEIAHIENTTKDFPIFRTTKRSTKKAS